MPIEIGKLERLYLGVESTPGTQASAAVLLPLREPATLQDKHEPIPIDYAVGNRYVEPHSVLGQRWGEGDIALYLDSVNAGYALKCIFGNETNTTVAAGVYDHNFYVIASGNQPRTASIYRFRGSTDQELFLYSTPTSVEINFSDGSAEVSSSWVSKFPSTTGFSEPSLTVTSGTYFSFRDAEVKFGATIAEAENATPISVQSLTLTLEQEIERIHGSGGGDVRHLRTKGFKASGSYDVYFDSVTERDNYRNLNKRAMIVQFNGINLGGTYREFVKFRIAKMRLQEAEVESGLDDFYVVGAEFACENDASQVPNVIDCIVRNNKNTVY